MHIKDADIKARDMRVDAEKEKHAYYELVVADMNKAITISAYENARNKFKNLGDYEDSAENVKKCQYEIDRLKEEECKEKATE